ncbi:MAG: N-acetylmuramidase domain-containing protein [Legionellaceae bacterium]|nr:N-acetylmuramidase domain-containing protein [Legionellaceae bacterium]
MVSETLLKEISRNNNIEYAALRAFIAVETGGIGFAKDTGKIIIQFEPVWFRRKAPYAPSGAWSVNKVDVQSKEWIAFNDAFRKNPNAAMQATSIGLGQIMGFHFSILGYKTVGAMWDDAKVGDYQQVLQLVRFLKAYRSGDILKALQLRNFTRVAELFNGSGFREVAKKYGREPYDISMEKAFKKYSAV